jgi:D-3-phosphoglycerate dehydrogenase
MPRIIVLDDIAEEGLAKLKAADGIEFDIKTGLSGDELRETLAKYDGAVCRSGVKITAESLEGNKQLKAIVRAGVGTDNIDKAAATRRGIVVMNTPDGNTVSTAEHAMALMLGLSRNVGPAYESLKSGKWDRKKFKGSQLSGKTLGVVGGESGWRSFVEPKRLAWTSSASTLSCPRSVPRNLASKSLTRLLNCCRSSTT